MSLPDKSKLLSLYEAGKKDSSLGLPTSGDFWSSSEDDVHFAYIVPLANVPTHQAGKCENGNKVLCVGD